MTEIATAEPAMVEAAETQDYFAGCETTDEVRDRYRDLALRHFNDAGVMEAVNAAFNAVIRTSTASEKPYLTETQVEEHADVADQMADAITRLAALPGISIEICGSWVWVTGDTKTVKDDLKAAGLQWAPRKDGQPWYWKPAGGRRRRGKNWSLDQIRTAHGSVRVGRSDD
jgi:hypothetical protein